LDGARAKPFFATMEWLKKKCEARAEEQARACNNEINYLRIVSQKAKTLWTGLAFIALLIVFIFGVAPWRYLRERVAVDHCGPCLGDGWSMS